MNPEEFHEKMLELIDDSDPEGSHFDMDELMCYVLEELGFEDGVQVFRHAYKYYA